MVLLFTWQCIYICIQEANFSLNGEKNIGLYEEVQKANVIGKK